MSQVARSLLRSPVKRFYSTAHPFEKARCFQFEGNAAVDGFNAHEPAVFKQAFNDIPAIRKWFTPSEADPNSYQLSTLCLEQYGDVMVPIEVTRPAPSDANSTTFERVEAPLSLLLAYMESLAISETRMYLAQHSLADLPAPMQVDLPTPALLSRLGRGDIYASSLWMGRPPTRTPLHRDPNPNLFVQLAGKKIVRLMKPKVGRAVYEQARREVGKQGGGANIRFEDMMEGEEVDNLERAVWNDEVEMSGQGGGVEAELKSGDGLYIPIGWWHAVRGVGTGANASANWWFR